MEFVPGKTYGLKFFSTHESKDEVHPSGNEVLSTMPSIFIKFVFDRITEGFVVIREVKA